MARRYRYSKSQIWEFIIIVAIILLVLYRGAWLYDFLPEKYLPYTIISNGYSSVKGFLITESLSPTVFGRISGSIVDSLNSSEKYLKEMDSKYRIEEATSERCQENSIFRFFMNIGEDANQKCTEGNLQLKNSIEEINHGSNSVPEPVPAPVTEPINQPSQPNQTGQ